MSKLLAGPWLGELGWELFGWQGMLRHMAQTRRFESVTVVGRPGHEVLYRDFADEFVPLPGGPETDGWRLDGKTPTLPGDLRSRLVDESTVHIRPGSYLGEPQRFIRYGSFDPASRYDVVLHARATTKAASGRRNWPPEKWSELVARLAAYRLASIGIKGTALHVPAPHAVDLRGIPLAVLVNVLSSSRLTVGSSSGPMHLASLCGCPHLVWTDNVVHGAVSATNRVRYERLWNPFKTLVRVVDQFGWDPPVDVIVAAVQTFLRGDAAPIDPVDPSGLPSHSCMAASTPPTAESAWTLWLRYWRRRYWQYGDDFVAYSNRQAREQAERIWALVEPFVGSHYGVGLDLRCGPGRFVARLAPRCARLIVADILEECVHRAAAKAENATGLVLRHPGRIDLPSHSVDLLWSCSALQHFVAPGLLDATADELRRVLKKGAHVVLVENAEARCPHCVGRPPGRYQSALGLGDCQCRPVRFDRGGETHHLIVGHYLGS